MSRKSDLEFKSFIEQIGVLIDARVKTLEYNINLHTLTTIKEFEGRIKKELRVEMATKDDIKRLEAKMATKDDIKDMATKQDIARLEEKIDETKSLKISVEELRKRLDKLEAELANVKSRN